MLYSLYTLSSKLKLSVPLLLMMGSGRRHGRSINIKQGSLVSRRTPLQPGSKLHLKVECRIIKSNYAKAASFNSGPGPASLVLPLQATLSPL